MQIIITFQAVASSFALLTEAEIAVVHGAGGVEDWRTTEPTTNGNG
ncbi:MAG: hypothetical protein JNM52_04680 [Betaproteobacteria bacterium]|nr:hypothetical protein [Betaproteobacteria bacterium]